MEMQPQTNEVPVAKELFIKMVLGAWETQNARVDKLLNSLSEQQVMAETAPGRNSGIYLVGHLIAVSDAIIPILGLGEKRYPQLAEIFIANPDKSALEKPSLADLIVYWNNVNDALREYFSKMQPDEWFTKHTAVSAEDFLKDPVRNKLNILINRTNHQSYHLGQLMYLAK